jgi:hypothetical protein
MVVGVFGKMGMGIMRGVLLGLVYSGLGRVARPGGTGDDVGYCGASDRGWDGREPWDVHWTGLNRGVAAQGVRVVAVMGLGSAGGVDCWVIGYESPKSRKLEWGYGTGSPTMS